MDAIFTRHTVVQPDSLFIRADRASVVRERIAGPLDLVVEVQSPSTTERDRLIKCILYAKHGVPE